MTETANRHRAGGELQFGTMFAAVLVVAFGSGCGIFGLGGGNSTDEESKPKPTSQDKQDTGTVGGGSVAQDEDESEPDVGTKSPSLIGESKDAGGTVARRNPFAPKVESEDEKDDKKGKKGKNKKNVGPLKKHELDKYQLVGIISEVAVPKAMFIAPDGKGYLVRESQRLGSGGGVISDIRANVVEIEVPKDREGAKPKVVTLELREKELKIGGQDELSARERRMLQKLMKSEEGRKAVRESFQKKAPAANATKEGGQRSAPRAPARRRDQPVRRKREPQRRREPRRRGGR